MILFVENIKIFFPFSPKPLTTEKSCVIIILYKIDANIV